MKSISTRKPSRGAGSDAGSPKWAWHFRALQKMRERLTQERSGKLRDASQQLEQHSVDAADSATDEFDHDLALSELSAQQTVLFEIDEALDRIRNDTYGVCVESGKLISPARLRAVPWTRFSKEVADRLESNGDVPLARLGRIGSVRGTAAGSLVKAEFERLESERISSAEELM